MPITLVAIATISGYVGSIVGRSNNMRIKSQEDRKKIEEALLQSEIFNELVNNGHTMEEIIEILDLKNARGKDFEDKTGVPWPL